MGGAAEEDARIAHRAMRCTTTCLLTGADCQVEVLTGVGVGVEVSPRVLAQPVVGGGVEVAGGHVASHLRMLI